MQKLGNDSRGRPWVSMGRSSCIGFGVLVTNLMDTGKVWRGTSQSSMLCKTRAIRFKFNQHVLPAHKVLPEYSVISLITMRAQEQGLDSGNHNGQKRLPQC